VRILCSLSVTSVVVLSLRGSLQVAIVIRKKSRSAGRTVNMLFVVVAKSHEVASRLAKGASREGFICTVPMGSLVRALRLRLHCIYAERFYV
jgi:hypothetical protein